MKKLLLILILLNSLLYSYNKEFSYRKYIHVKEFYKTLIQDTVKLGLKYNIPPAALLAIASVESGYGRGYVASISGNILSLGANKNEKALPSLYLPNIKEPYKIIYNPSEIKKYTSQELRYKQREKSLKKDYRPEGIAGTTNNLDFFDKNLSKKQKANMQNIKDFCTKWISEKNNHLVFRKARMYLEQEVKKHGKEILFSKKLNEDFIKSIGGKKNSFNFRASWSKKIIQVLKKTGLINLSYEISKGKSFKQSWEGK